MIDQIKYKIEFVIFSLDSIIPLDFILKISRLKLAFYGLAEWFESYLVIICRDRIVMTWLIEFNACDTLLSV